MPQAFTRMKTRLLTLSVLALGVAGILAAPRTVNGICMLHHHWPWLLPASQLARNLESTDTNVVRESLGVLRDYKNPIGADRAVRLLASPDDYVWLNAVLYLGAVGRAEAVPYLIKSLRHTAWRAEADNLSALQRITSQSFGTDFQAWRGWWVAAHPGTAFDFDSKLGPNPRR